MANYIDQVLAGKIQVPKLVRLAIDRHLKDLKKSERPSYPFYYDETAGAKVIKFISALKIKQERSPAKNVELQLWQVFFITQIFGWKRKSDNTRRFDNVYLSIPKKNGKTALAGWITVYLMLAEANFTWSGIVAATTKYQAMKLLKDIKSIIRSDSNLRALLTNRAEYIEHTKLKTQFTVRATEVDALDGLNENYMIIDEFHTQKTDELYSILRNGLGSKLNQLLLIITTAGEHPDYFAREHELYLSKILQGKEENDTLFALMYQPDREDDLESEKTWKKVNPNWGVSFSSTAFLSKFNEAHGRPTLWYKFRTKHLNLWNRTYNVWFEEEEVRSKFLDLKEEDYSNYPAYSGLDLSTTGDFSGYTITVKTENKIVTFFRIWIPEDTLEDRIKGESIEFRKWVEDGHIFTCPGKVIDVELIYKQFQEDVKKFNIRQLAYDPAIGGNAFGKRVAAEIPSVQAISFSQHTGQIWPATKSFEDFWKRDKLLFDNNPAALWNFANATIINGPKGGQKVGKPEDKKQRVDMVICAIMGLDRALIDFEASATPTPLIWTFA